MKRRSLLGLQVALASMLCVGPSAQTSGDPVDSEQREQVRVQLALLDAVVVDWEGRTVPDLTIEDFEVRIGRRWTAPDTLDLLCPGGAAEEPVNVENPGLRAQMPMPGFDRKIVLVVDYQNVPDPDDRYRLLDIAQRMVGEGSVEHEQIMIASLTGGLRIELPFTSDRGKVADKLREMQHDVSLYARQFPAIHAHGFYASIKALLGVLEFLPGPKAVVLYSNLDEQSGFYDLEYFEIAALAATSRAAVYPVDVRGLGPGRTVLGGSGLLGRLAVDTGGRYTRLSDDLSLGYARARRDMGCRYAVGVYVSNVALDKRKSIVVRTTRAGLKVHAPSSYMFRSEEAKRRAAIFSRFMAPELFSQGVLRGHAFPLRPANSHRWESVLIVNFPVTFDPAEGNEQVRDFGVTLHQFGKVIHKFDRRMTLRVKEDEGVRERRVTFVSFVDLKPGQYTLGATLVDPNTDFLDSAKMGISIPRLPEKHRLSLVPPILGREAGKNVVVTGNVEGKKGARNDQVGHSGSFEPLLVQETTLTAEILALTRACLTGKSWVDEGDGIYVDRSIRSDDSDDLGELPPDRVQLEASRKVRCDTMLDALPTAFFDPGNYIFEALLESDDSPGKEEVPFALTPP